MQIRYGDQHSTKHNTAVANALDKLISFCIQRLVLAWEELDGLLSLFFLAFLNLFMWVRTNLTNIHVLLNAQTL